MIMCLICRIGCKRIARQTQEIYDVVSLIRSNCRALNPSMCRYQRSEYDISDQQLHMVRAWRYKVGFSIDEYRSTIPYINFWCASNLMSNQTIDNILGMWSKSCNQADLVNIDSSWLREENKKIPSWAYIGINNGTCNFAVIKGSERLYSISCSCLNELSVPDILDALHPKWTAVQIFTPILVFLVTVLSGASFLAWRHSRLQRSSGRKNPSCWTSFLKLFKGHAPGVIHRSPDPKWMIDGPHGLADHDAESFISINSSNHEVSHWSADTDHGMLGVATIRGLGKRVKNLLSWFGARSARNGREESNDSRRSSSMKSPSSTTKGEYSEIGNDENITSSIIVIGGTPAQSSDSNHQPLQGVGTVGDAANIPKSPTINVSLEPPSPSDEYVPVRFPPTIPEVRQFFQPTQIPGLLF